MHNPYEDDQDTGDINFRVTELIGAPLPKTLFARHRDSDELIIDCSFYLPMMFGTAFHKLCEGETTSTVAYEQRVNICIAEDNGVPECNIFGTIDETLLIDPNMTHIKDNKTGMISHMNYPVKTDYQWQLNIYRILLGAMVPEDHFKLFVRMFLKDFTTIGAARDHTKPQCMMQTREVAVKLRNEVFAFIANRIIDHTAQPERPCTMEERNFGSVKFAVERRDRKRALRVTDNYADALTYFNQMKPAAQSKAAINRRAEDIKCKYYCQVVSVCPYAQQAGYRPV